MPKGAPFTEWLRCGFERTVLRCYVNRIRPKQTGDTGQGPSPREPLTFNKKKRAPDDHQSIRTLFKTNLLCQTIHYQPTRTKSWFRFKDAVEAKRNNVNEADIGPPFSLPIEDLGIPLHTSEGRMVKVA